MTRALVTVSAATGLTITHLAGLDPRIVATYVDVLGGRDG